MYTTTACSNKGVAKPSVAKTMHIRRRTTASFVCRFRFLFRFLGQRRKPGFFLFRLLSGTFGAFGAIIDPRLHATSPVRRCCIGKLAFRFPAPIWRLCRQPPSQPPGLSATPRTPCLRVGIAHVPADITHVFDTRVFHGAEQPI